MGFRFTEDEMRGLTDKSAPVDGGPLDNELAERMSTAKVRLLNRYPFFGSLVCRLRFRATERELAAVTNSGMVYMNPKYAAMLTEPELAGVLVHEVLHPALLHFVRRGARDPMLWNIAGDYAINAMIAQQAKACGGSWVSDGALPLHEEKYAGWTVDAIYEDLFDKAEKITVNYIGDMVPGDGQPMTEEQEEYWKQVVLQAAAAHRAAGRGDLPAGVDLIIESITSPEVPWTTELSQYVGDNYSGMDYGYRRPSRRQRCVGGGIVLAAPDKTTAPDIIVLADTSGSMYGWLERVLAEIDGIAKSVKAPIRVIFCDAAVQGDVTDVRSAQDLLDKIKGGGGSDYRPAFEHIKTADKRCVIIAPTDGYITVPDEDPGFQGLVWLVTSDGVDPTDGKYGRVIRLNGSEWTA